MGAVVGTYEDAIVALERSSRGKLLLGVGVALVTLVGVVVAALLGGSLLRFSFCPPGMGLSFLLLKMSERDADRLHVLRNDSLAAARLAHVGVLIERGTDLASALTVAFVLKGGCANDGIKRSG